MGSTRSLHPSDAVANPEAVEPARPVECPDDGHRRLRNAGMAVLIASLAVAAIPAAPLWVVLVAVSTAASLGLPLLLAGSPRAAAIAVPVAVVVLAGLAGWAAVARANGHRPERDREHDGGVLVTRAAADDLSHLRNPYVDDFGPVLPPSWRLVQGIDGSKVVNPVRHHFPYLPAAAMVHVPFVAAAGVLGTTWDPRVLGWVAMVGALILLARRPEPAWMRVGAILGVGSAFSVVYLAWGTNDLLAVSPRGVALGWAQQRPGWAGTALAVALSAKVVLLVVVPPLALAVFLAGGWKALKRWWTLPAALAVTCVPFWLAAPGAFVDDTIWFNLGRAKPLMPTSGIGLPAAFPGTFHGTPLALVTLAGFTLAVGFPIWAVLRWPSVWTAGAASAVALLGVLVPARTFQTNYLVLVVGLLSCAWLAGAACGRTSDGARGPTRGVDSRPTEHAWSSARRSCSVIRPSHADLGAW